REKTAESLPDTVVISYRSIAEARASTRYMLKKFGRVILGVLFLSAGIMVAVIMLANARERREEVGIFLAMGMSPAKVAAVFLTKLLLASLLAAILAFAVGSGIATRFGTHLFKSPIKMSWMILWYAVPVSLAFAALFGALPVLFAARLDPVKVLQEP
ncbi:unnamed protein product, partial [marine sediment metagenome]